MEVGDISYVTEMVMRFLLGEVAWNHIMDPFHAEVVACLQGVQAAIDLGAHRIILETDALLVKQAVDSRSWSLSLVGGLITEIQDLVFLNCNDFKTFDVPRSCNGAAHALAALGCECSENGDPIVDPIPDCIMSIVAADCAAHE